MKITCKRDVLLEQLNITAKAVSTRTTLPILEYFLLKTKETGFTLTGNNLELGIESSLIDAELDEEGTIALEARLFSEIIRKVNGETVLLELKEKSMVKILSGSSVFHIMCQPGDDFPALPMVESQTTVSLPQKELRNLIRQTIFSISQEESKPILTGELLEIEGNQISLVSVDGYRISFKKAEIREKASKKSVVIPGKTLNEISKILSQEDDCYVNIFLADKHILFEIDGCIVVSRLLEGEFIKYQQSFTDDYKTKMIVDKNEFISCLERASLISRDSRKTPVKLNIAENSIIMSATTEFGTSCEQMPIETDGNALEIGFNPKYLIDALRVIEEEKVSIQFTTPLSPCIIKGIEDSSYQYLILPLRM